MGATAHILERRAVVTRELKQGAAYIKSLLKIGRITQTYTEKLRVAWESHGRP